MRKATELFIFLLLLFSASAAGASDRAGVAPLFSLGGGGRALAMGGANAALANDPSAVFWNSAALAFLPARSLSFMHLSLPEGSNYDFAALGWPTVDYGTFSAAAFLITTDNIEHRDSDGRLLGSFSANQQMYLLGYGKNVNRYLSLGATLKLFGHNLESYSSFGAGADIGIILNLTENLALGFNAQNLLAPQVRLSRETESLPRNLKGGIGVSVPLADDRIRISLEGDVDKTEHVDPQFHFGGEIGVRNTYFLRGGYDINQFSVGAAVKIRFTTLGYAYRTDPVFDAQHRFSLDLSFGGSVESILARRERERRRASEELARQEKERELNTAMNSARAFYAKGEYDSAEVTYQKVLALAGANKEASDRLSIIEEERSKRLSAEVRAGVLAESDSLKAAELFQELSSSIELKDLQTSRVLAGRLQPAFGSDPRFVSLEEGYRRLLNQKVGALRNEATAAARGGQLAAALLKYDQILTLDPNDNSARSGQRSLSSKIDALSLLRDGIFAFNGGDTANARVKLEQVLALVPDDSLAALLIKQISAPAGESSRSLSSIQADSTNWRIYLEGIEQFRDGNYQRAIVLWEQVLVAYPGNPETMKNIQQAKLRLQSSSATD